MKRIALLAAAAAAVAIPASIPAQNFPVPPPEPTPEAVETVNACFLSCWDRYTTAATSIREHRLRESHPTTECILIRTELNLLDQCMLTCEVIREAHGNLGSKVRTAFKTALANAHADYDQTWCLVNDTGQTFPRSGGPGLIL